MRQRLVNRPRFTCGAAPLICVIVLALGAARSFADCVPQWIPAPGQPGMNDRVTAMTVFDDGSGGGPALIVGGRFTMAGGQAVTGLAKWTGTSWQQFGSNLPFGEVLALAVYDRGNGPELYAAGFGIVRWNGSAWVAVPNAPASWIGALYVHDAGEGLELYVSGGFGSFPTLDGPTDYVARWNGTNWRSVGQGLVSVVQEFATFNDGIGPALFAVGSFVFFNGGGGIVIGFGRFNGQAWSGAGGGFDGGDVEALKLYNDGAGPALYAGGNFIVAGGTSIAGGGIAANRIARWNGRHWSTLGAGVNGRVNALAVFDEDGAGPNPPALFAAGEFTMAGGIPASHVARWNGSTWSALGGAGGAGVNGSAHALGASPNGAMLFVGGDFTAAGSMPANHIAGWTCVPSVVGDINGDGHVNVQDLLAVILSWGACPVPPATCPADIVPPGGDAHVNVDDLLAVITHWG